MPLARRRLPSINTAGVFAFPVDSDSQSNGLILARPSSGGLHILNPTAQLIWEKLSAGESLAQIRVFFQSVFGLSAEVAQRDIEAVVAQWSAAGLLLKQPPISPPDLSPLPSAHPGALILDCRLNGTCFRISVDPGQLTEEIVPRLKHLAASCSVPDVTLTVTLPDGELPSSARILLLQEMTRLCAPGRETRATLHAGACGTQFACVVLAGDTGAGKSTLCAALMAEGLVCYTDDSVLLDSDFQIAGMPFPIMLREGSWRFCPQVLRFPVYYRWGTAVRFLPSNLPAATSPAVPPRALLFVDYQPAAPASLAPISTLDALLGLQRSGFWVDPNPDNIAAFLAWLSRLPKYRLSYSNLSDATREIRRLLS